MEYLNTIDTTYRVELERLNDANWARFEARLDQHVAEFRGEFAAMRAELIKYMFAFWAGSAITTVATVWGVVSLIAG